MHPHLDNLSTGHPVRVHGLDYTPSETLERGAELADVWVAEGNGARGIT